MDFLRCATITCMSRTCSLANSKTSTKASRGLSVSEVPSAGCATPYHCPRQERKKEEEVCVACVRPKVSLPAYSTLQNIYPADMMRKAGPSFDFVPA